jgi:hypothetical protein
VVLSLTSDLHPLRSNSTYEVPKGDFLTTAAGLTTQGHGVEVERIATVAQSA